ncbi:MAG: hypothetical protein AAFV31_07010 [Pseudomonadota bacterium]
MADRDDKPMPGWRMAQVATTLRRAFGDVPRRDPQGDAFQRLLDQLRDRPERT